MCQVSIYFLKMAKNSKNVFFELKILYFFKKWKFCTKFYQIFENLGKEKLICILVENFINTLFSIPQILQSI